MCIPVRYRLRRAPGPDAHSTVRCDVRWDAVRTVDLLALDGFGAQ